VFQQYGAANSAVALVLDASGSMKDRVPKDGPRRFEKATAALRKVLRQLPDGVWVSLHVYSSAQHPGIHLLWKGHAWKSSDLDMRMKQVGELVPQYNTPLIRSLKVAQDELERVKDRAFRSIVVLTDGADSTFYDTMGTDNDLKREGATVREFLENRFRDSGIQVSAIGFEINEGDFQPYEARALREFVKAINALPLGKYYDAADSTRLASALQQSLLQMRFWIDAAAGLTPYGPLPNVEADISRSDWRQNPRWIGHLYDGSYTVFVRAHRLLQQAVRIGPGESLILDLIPHPEGKARLGFRRSLYGESHYVTTDHWRVVPPVEVAREKGAPAWLLAVLQNQAVGDGLQLMTTLEQRSTVVNPNLSVQQVRPWLTWFELSGPAGVRPPQLTVTSLSRYPAPAFGLDVPRWPRKAAPSLQAWWLEGELPRAYTLLRFSDYTDTPEELSGRVLEVKRLERGETANITIESIAHEVRKVELEPGRPRDKVDCLVVRLSFPPDGEPFFVRPSEPGLGQEHRFYPKAGKYTGIFWSLTDKQVRELKDLDVFSVAELKAKALHLPKPLDLDTPDDIKTRPVPPPEE
jgi:hypothetical protein